MRGAAHSSPMWGYKLGLLGREGTLQWYQLASGKAWAIYSQLVHSRPLGPYMKCDLGMLSVAGKVGLS